MNDAYLKKHNIHNYYEGAFKFEATKERYEQINGRPTIIINAGYKGEWGFEAFNKELQNPIEHFRLPYRNHNPYWTLCDIPIRNKVREWLYTTIDEKTGTYTLSGKVTDKKGNPIINIRVQTGLTHFVYTDETGFYSIEGLIDGNRDVMVKKTENVITTKNINISENNMECNFTLTNF